MIKTLLIIVGLFLLLILTGLALFLFKLWWHARKQPPAYALIIEKYYACYTYQNLYGGIFGKGPTQQFFGKRGRRWCWRHEWQEIDRTTFKRLATEWYGIDWNQESPYWQNDRSADTGHN